MKANVFVGEPRPLGVPGDLTLRECSFKTNSARYRAECGTILVRADHREGSSRLLVLPVKRIHSASNAPQEPIFFLGGGPGVTNMRFNPPDVLLEKHDVVIVGYRGVDGSSVLRCPEFSDAVHGDGKDVFSDASLKRMADAIRAARVRAAASGIDWSEYTIEQSVEDFEAVRAALGYTRVNLLSESYGTRVAQVYADLHPTSMFRSAMIGVNPPGRFVWEPHMVDKQIEYYGCLWEKDETARRRSPNLAASMRQVSHNMPRRWLFFPIDAGKVNAVAFVMLFQRRTASQVFDAYLAAAEGDASGLALMSMAYDLLVPKAFVWGDFFAKGGAADLDPLRDYAATLRTSDSIIGSPISLLIWAPLSEAWPSDEQPPRPRTAPLSDVETLLVSGSVDFSTPAEYATEELLPSLRNGKQVILHELGHVGDVWNVQPLATQRLLSSFFATGIADDSLYRTVTMDFRVRFGFPVLAKVLLAASMLLAIGLGFLGALAVWNLLVHAGVMPS